ncbi:hypothetical protein T09_2354 [Trichinella sp. T9]|nr:hypothetical protein T09_2354 [Trichinella sp. T9]
MWNISLGASQPFGYLALWRSNQSESFYWGMESLMLRDIKEW